MESLQLPPADLKTLNFVSHIKLSEIKHWADRLPVTQINRTATLLYKAIPQITRLTCSPDNRVTILETVRPQVQQNLEGLCRQFIDQPLLHSEAATKAVIISQSIQKHMTHGYCRAALDILVSRNKLKSAEKEKLALCLHRAMTGCCLQIVRSAQIYTVPPSHLWTTLNVCYRVAKQLDLSQTRCADSILQRNAAMTVEQVYHRALLLGCSSLNTLTPREIDAVFDACEDWSQFVSLQPQPRSPQDIHCIDLSKSEGPVVCRAESAEPSITPTSDVCLTPIFSNLLETLDKVGSLGAEKSPIPIPERFPSHLLKHLMTAWGSLRERGATRNRNELQLEIAVGLSSVHYLLAGERSFQEFRQSNNTRSRFQAANSNAPDPWDSAFDSEGLGRDDFELGFSLDIIDTPRNVESSSKPPCPVYRVKRLDFSTTGMRVEWAGDIPPLVKTGEIVSIMERGGTPLIGVIRWARQYKTSTQLGIEIIATKATPAAAQQLKKVGEDGVYMHALRCINRSDKTHTEQLLTASRPFAEGDKVNIQEMDENYKASLSRLRIATSSVRLFNLRRSQSSTTEHSSDSFEDSL